eukprot:53106_1
MPISLAISSHFKSMSVFVLLVVFVPLVLGQSQTNTSTCPDTIHGCSVSNQCNSCDFELCQFCQNTEDSLCIESDCMTCNDPSLYSLVPISSDGTGYCEYIGNQQQISFGEFENIIHNHGIVYQTSSSDHLYKVPLFSITFLYNDRVFIFGGLLFDQLGVSLHQAGSNYEWGQVYISDNTPTAQIGSTPSTPSTPSPFASSGNLCCDCVYMWNYTGCPEDAACEQSICAYNSGCCDYSWGALCGQLAWYTCNTSVSNDATSTPYPSQPPTVFDTDYKATCPSWIDGCSTDNACDECYYLCEYCQNTDTAFSGTTCTVNDCVSCVAGYELIAGSCEAVETTPSPTADYLIPDVMDWHSYDLFDTLHPEIYYFCTSQCYTTPIADYGSSQADTVYMLFPFNCADFPPILFEIYPLDLLHGLMFEGHEEYDLSEFLCDASIFEDVLIEHSQNHSLVWVWNQVCLAWHPLDWTLYIVYRDRILLWDVDLGANHSHWSDARLSGFNSNATRGCMVDQWSKYVWITDDDANLFAYDISADTIIDVGSYNAEHHPVEYYQDSNDYYRINASKYYYSYYDIQYPRMVPLNDDFILISSSRSHHILKSNTTSSWHNSTTQSKYGDVLCHGTLPSDIHAFSAPVYRDYSVVHFGALMMNESNCDLFDDDENNPSLWHVCAKNAFPHHKISYFEWQKYWRLILAPVSSSVLFGDRFVIDNELVGGCDLSFYYDRPYDYSIYELGSFGIEVYIESDIIYSTFMYLIDAAKWELKKDGKEYYGAYNCYLCPNAIEPLAASTFSDEDRVLAQCVLCGTGIRTSVTDKSAAGILYDIHMEITGFYGNLVVDLQTEQSQILLKSCRAGYGIAAGSSVFDCNECPFNQFTLRAQLAPCIACSGVFDGLECEGANRTIVSYNFWVAAYDENTNKLKPFYEIASYDAADYTDLEVPSDDSIITALCPPKYCCQSVLGCDYLSQYLSNISAPTLCAEGRDITVPLCGRCLAGYAEMLGTTKCGNTCDKEYLALIPITFTITLILAVYVVFFDSKPSSHIADESDSNLKEINVTRMLKKDAIDGFKMILFKPVLYYFQALSPMLNTRGITLWLSPVLAFFNFNLDAAGSDGSALCWSSTLNANTEILLNLIFPVFLMLNIIAPTILLNSNGQCRCYRRGAFMCFGVTFIPYYAPSFFRVLLIVIGVVLTVCFKYLTFIDVAGKQLMFYSADLEAFGAWWISGFIGIILIILCFVFLFWRIKRQQMESRFASSNKYRKFVKSYKRKYWFWEFVLFSRRFFIALFTSIQFVGGDYTNFIFVLVLIMYLCLQIQYKPFAFGRVNRIETLCLILLLAAFVCVNFVRLDGDDTFVAAVLSICILIPLVLVIWYAIQITRFHLKMKRLNEASRTDRADTNRMLRKDVSKMLKRTPKSFKDAMQNMQRCADEEEKDDEFEDVVITATTTKHSDLLASSTTDYVVPTPDETIEEDVVLEANDVDETRPKTSGVEAMMMDEIELVNMKTDNGDGAAVDTALSKSEALQLQAMDSLERFVSDGSEVP